MKKYLVLGLTLMLSACSKVPAGYTGIKVDLLGSDKGVQAQEVGVGRYWIGFNEELYLFPNFTQNYVWTADSREGSEDNESISFQSTEGLDLNTDIGISYHIEPSKTSDIFTKYRKGIDEITNIFLRNMVRDALVNRASAMDVEDIYSKGKTKLIKQVQEDIVAQVEEQGIIIEKIYWIGKIRLPKEVTDAITAKITATQRASTRQNEVAEAKAKADKAIEAARGRAKSKSIEAKADAEAIRLKGKALNEYPNVIKLEYVNKWNGVEPQVKGSATPIVDMR